MTSVGSSTWTRWGAAEDEPADVDLSPFVERDSLARFSRGLVNGSAAVEPLEPEADVEQSLPLSVVVSVVVRSLFGRPLPPAAPSLSRTSFKTDHVAGRSIGQRRPIAHFVLTTWVVKA